MGAIVRISSVCCPALVEWGVAHGSQHLWGPLMGALHPDLFLPSFGFCSKILKVFLVHIRKYKWFPNGSHPSLSFLKLFYTTFFSRWPAVKHPLREHSAPPVPGDFLGNTKCGPTWNAGFSICCLGSLGVGCARFCGLTTFFTPAMLSLLNLTSALFHRVSPRTPSPHAWGTSTFQGRPAAAALLLTTPGLSWPEIRRAFPT